MGKTVHTAFINTLIVINSFCFAQDKRAQYPPVLINSYFGVDIGYIDYNFTQHQLEPGYSAASVHVPHTAVQVMFGHQFSKYLSAQLSYMRPVAFVEYKNVNGTGHDYEVGMNVFGFSLKPSLPVSKNVVINGHAGAAVVTRGGFIVINETGVKDAVYITLLAGVGVGYRLNKNWQLTLNGNWSPGNSKFRQPATLFYSAGFNYLMQPLPKEKVDRNGGSGFFFPRQILQIAYTTNVAGYGVNKFVSKDAHIFWAGAAQAKSGISVNYQKNIFHSRKVFSLDWGAGLAYWKSRVDQEAFYTFSVYPLFRFSFLRSKSADLYFMYSFAGPSFISKTTIDQKETGEHFTFQDFMGFGVSAGKQRHFNAEIKISHYSNGNVFPQNNGVMVPLTFGLGYSF